MYSPKLSELPYVLTCTTHCSADVPRELGAGLPYTFQPAADSGEVYTYLSLSASLLGPAVHRLSSPGRLTLPGSHPVSPHLADPDPPLYLQPHHGALRQKAENTLWLPKSESCLVHNEAGNISSPVTRAQLSFLSGWAVWCLGQASVNSAVTSAWALQTSLLKPLQSTPS